MFDLEELLTLDDAHDYLAKRGVHVKRDTLRVWINRGHLDVAKRDTRGHATHVTVLALARAELLTRNHARRTVAVGRAA